MLQNFNGSPLSNCVVVMEWSDIDYSIGRSEVR
jgi:hypothetical protein